MVSNVSAVQRPGTRLIDISYNLATPGFPFAEVWIEASSDGGATFLLPVVTVSGDAGYGVSPGVGKVATWDAGADWPGQQTSQMRFRVGARDDLPEDFGLIPAGSFLMGASFAEGIYDAPMVQVTVTPYYIQNTETTLAQWTAVRTWAAGNGYTDLAAGAGAGPDHPVHSVTWFDIVKWCNARSEMEGLTPVYTVAGAVMRSGATVPTADWGANGYRLPTEAEWEKAARGDAVSLRFPSGESISHDMADYRSDVSFAYDTSSTRGHHPTYGAGTAPVGSFAANAYGLHDLAGNVAEFCWDLYDGDYYYFSNGTTNPTGSGSGVDRVVRGGSWNSLADDCRSAQRGRLDPATASDEYGFRVARGRLVDRFATIPGGAFTMGVTTGDSDSDAPAIPVDVSTFYLQETETTKAAWDEVRDWALSNGYDDLAAGEGKSPGHPVHSVSWWDVVKWCNARSERDGVTPCYTVDGEVMRTGTGTPVVDWSANGYRLPTEAEWEKASRGGVVGRRFPRGTDTITHGGANYLSSAVFSYDTSPTRGNHPTYNDGQTPYTCPAGTFQLNGFALREMSGNVAEWCWDWYSPTGYAQSSGTIDPRGPESGAARVFRGGSWDASAAMCRAAARQYSVPESLNQQGVGFRSARSSYPRTDPRSPAPSALSATGFDLTVDSRSPNADLVGLFVSSGSLAPVFSSGTVDYELNVDALTASLLLVPTAAESASTLRIRVNGGGDSSVASGAFAGPYPIEFGENQIEIEVTAPNGTVTRDYSLLVTRPKQVQNIDFAPIAPRLATGSVDLAATGGGSGNPVVFRIDGGPGVIDSNGRLTFSGAGVVTVIASQAGSAAYQDATEVVRTVVVSKSSGLVTLDGLGHVYDGNPAAASATTQPEGLPVVITYNGSATAPSAAGTYDVAATISHPLYEGAASGSLVVARAATSIDFTAPADQWIGASPLLPAAPGVIYEIVSGPARLYNGNTLSFTGEGQVTVTATRPEDANHEAAGPVTRSFKIVAPRPDLAVGAKMNALKGVRVYTAPSTQAVSILLKKKLKPVKGYLSVSNRAILPARGAAEPVRVTGSKGNRMLRVSYFGTGGNLTAKILTGTYRTAAIDGSDKAVMIQSVAKPSKKHMGGKKPARKKRPLLTNLVRTSSTVSPSIGDGGILRVQTR